MSNERELELMRVFEITLDELRGKHPLHSLINWIYYNRTGSFYEVDELMYGLIWRIKHGIDIEPYSVEYNNMMKDIIGMCKEISTKLHFECKMSPTCKMSIREYVERVSRTYLEYKEFVQNVDCDWFFNAIR
jgi:hypothetical protein